MTTAERLSLEVRFLHRAQDLDFWLVQYIDWSREIEDGSLSPERLASCRAYQRHCREQLDAAWSDFSQLSVELSR